MSGSSWTLHCIGCGREFDPRLPIVTCTDCSNLLELRITGSVPTRGELFPSDGEFNVWRYRSALPIARDVDPITLDEGGTPLLKSLQIGAEHGLSNLHFKNEGQNPTGSFKDRGMTVAITRAKLAGVKVLVCASTGNTSASLAAYASRARIKSVVIIPSGKVAPGKLAQAVVYGARILPIEGTFDKALELTLEMVGQGEGMYLMNSVNPYRIEGQKTAAFEIYEQLGNLVPDYVVLPVGNAGNISAYWKAFAELKAWGIADRVPKMIGVQAEGAAPIVEALSKSLDHVSAWSSPRTLASAIRIGNPVSWKKAMTAIRDSGGFALSVSDDEIVSARKAMAMEEGLFVEAASATPVAALKKIAKKIAPKSVIVCVATGNGLKDQDSIELNLDDATVYKDAKSLMRAIF